MTSSQPRRGEIWRVQFNPTRGDEIQKTRLAIITSLAEALLESLLPCQAFQGDHLGSTLTSSLASPT